MSDRIKIVLDAMGGDDAPEVTVKGAIEALQASDKISMILTGKTDVIEKELKKYTYDEDRMEVVQADEVIGFDEEDVNDLCP